MPLSLQLKRLKLKMASMQSSRTQCCCCAIGVLAALFGIFMLSAGICIVLNVNYMEVDTSGLPPELHNEEGKKIVGIILICVAIGAMGLSGTVSIIYFAVCNRKPTRAVLTTTAAGTGQEGAVNNRSNGFSNSQHSRHASQSSQQRTSVDGTRNASDSQPSLNSLSRQRRPSPSLTPSRGVTGLRKKTQKVKSHHRMRHPRYQTGLPPHIEEPETAKSQVDLKLHHSQSAETASSSQSSMGLVRSSTSFTVDETQRDTSFSLPTKSENPPVIVINGSSHHHMSSEVPVTDSVAYSTDDADPSISFSDANNVGESYNIMTEESTLYDDEVETAEPSIAHSHSHSEFQQTFSDNMSTIDTVDSKHSSHPIPSSDLAEQTSKSQPSHPVSNSPESMIPSSADVASELVEQSSIDSHTYNVVQVQPQNSFHLSNPQSDENSNLYNGQWDSDHVSELPPSSRHYEMYSASNDNDSEKRCESQSSFNSAFSNDGGDPDDEDMKKMHEKMRELLE